MHDHIADPEHPGLTGHHGLSAKGNATLPQNFLEESIPLIVRHPDAVKRGEVVTVQVDHCDLHATLKEIAGLEPTATSPGQSWLSYLTRPDSQADLAWRKYQFCEYGNARMIRTDDGLKLIKRYPGPNGHFGDELYNLNDDPRECSNVIADPQYSDVIIELSQTLNTFFSKYEDEKCTGTKVGELMPFNPVEVWRRTPE